MTGADLGFWANSRYHPDLFVLVFLCSGRSSFTGMVLCVFREKAWKVSLIKATAPHQDFVLRAELVEDYNVKKMEPEFEGVFRFWNKVQSLFPLFS